MSSASFSELKGTEKINLFHIEKLKKKEQEFVDSVPVQGWMSLNAVTTYSESQVSKDKDGNFYLD